MQGILFNLTVRANKEREVCYLSKNIFFKLDPFSLPNWKKVRFNGQQREESLCVNKEYILEMVGILFKLPVRAYKENFFQAWPFFALNWKRIKRLEFAIDRYPQVKV